MERETMNRKSWMGWLLAVFLILAACGGQQVEPSGNEQESEQGSEAPVEGSQTESTGDEVPAEEVDTRETIDGEEGKARKETQYPLIVTDASGHEMVFESAPQRIISTSPAETEILFAIGLEDQI